MALRDYFKFGSKGVKSDGRSAVPTSAPALAPALPKPMITASFTPASPQMGALDGTDGNTHMVWARYDSRPFTSGYMSHWNPYFGTPGAEVSRERALVSSVLLDLVHSNPTIATMVETLATYAVGNGLTLSSRPNAEALGISQEEADALAHQIETAWAAWAGSAAECDSSGRFTLHQLATAVFKSYVLTGEALFTVDWKKASGANTRTKIALLDVRQLDQSISRVIDGSNIFQGVQIDKDGRVEGYWIVPSMIGNINSARQAVFIKARTTWGRTRVGHLFDLLMPGQIRGLSPLVAALTSAQSKRTLQEFSLAQALVQSMSATTVESDLPREAALGKMASEDPYLPQGGIPPNSAANPSENKPGNSLTEWLAAKAKYYENVNIDLRPGVVTHMLKGEKLVMHRTQSPNSTYADFDSSLLREAAKAAGLSAEDASGDYSKTSFSASRLAQELPWRINLRHRQAIVEAFYRAAFSAWLEEQIETANIALPKGAPEFWQASAAYTNSVWRGSQKPTSDPLKQAQADILEVENGLATLECKLGERGYDLEEVIKQRKYEREQLEAANLNYPVPKNRDAWVDTDKDEM